MKYEKILNDPKVSLALKSLYIICLEHRYDQNFTLKCVANLTFDCSNTILKYMKMLADLGYVSRGKYRSSTPNFMNSQWYFKEIDK